MFPSPEIVRWSRSADLSGARRPPAACRDGPPRASRAAPGRVEPEVRSELTPFEELPGAEAADVAVGDVRAVVELEHGTRMRILGQPSPLSMTEGARHPQVHQKGTAGLERDDQILAAATDRGDSLADQLVGDDRGVERAHEARVANLDALEARPLEHRRDRPANRLDLRQLRHSSSLGSGPRRQARSPRQACADPGRRARLTRRRRAGCRR